MNFVELNRRFGQFTPFGHPLVTLNIKDRHSTDLVKYRMRGHIHVFTARRPYLFDTVFNGNNVIWAPKTHEYPDIVFVKYRRYGNNLLRVFFPRETGSYLNFNRHRSHRRYRHERESIKREEDTVQKNRQDAYKHLQDIKILTEGSSFQNDFSKFDVYKIGKVDQFYMFKFKDGVRCTGVQYVHKMTNPNISDQIFTQDRTVWKHGDFDRSEHPRAVYSHGVYKFMFIEFNENSFYFYRKSTSAKDWKHVLLENVRSLDLSRLKLLTYKSGHRELKELHPDKYLLYNLGFAYQIVFKDSAMCEQIQYDDELLYVHDLIGDYPLFIYLMFNKCCEVVYHNTAHYVYA
ncbi:hypothetical protein MACK_003136 [Theileria orientalis]|uniref:Uncharacterized protein n=1 Tax=Theileria orientalis TaxID=68886 RepID=A0A976MEL8_THEOR|nr:hypothetical protein MACK_003136 [Theileria orientalis]